MHSAPFGCLTKLGAKWAELVQKFVPRSCVEIFCNERTCFGAFRTIWVHSGPLGCLIKLGAKWAELVPKFVLGCLVGIFRNEQTRSIPLEPKLTFWRMSNYLGASGTVWLLHKTRCKTGRTSAKVRATKSFRNFSQRTHSIRPIGP